MTDRPEDPKTPSRRSFLRTAATGLAAAPFIGKAGAEVVAAQGPQPAGTVLPDRAVGRPMLSSVQLPQRAPEYRGDGRRIGIAIVGLGSYAMNQIMPRIAQTEGVRLAAVVSGNPDKARRTAAAYGLPESQVYSYETFDRIADDPSVDAVYIILPTGLHAEWSIKALNAGKHVLCEKPMASSPEECEAMIAAAKKADRRLMIGYRCHFEPFNLAAMEMTTGGEIGGLTTIVTNQHRTASLSNPTDVWRLDKSLASGGALPDYGIYGVNAAYYLTGENPSEVTAHWTQPKDDPRFLEVEDLVAAQLRFPSGTVAQISTSYSSANSNFCQVIGKDGTILMDPATYYGGNSLVVTRGRDRRDVDAGDSTVQFARMMDHFASAVLDGTTIRTPGEMGLRDIRLITAIYTACREGRTVKLNPDQTMVG